MKEKKVLDGQRGSVPIWSTRKDSSVTCKYPVVGLQDNVFLILRFDKEGAVYASIESVGR